LDTVPITEPGSRAWNYVTLGLGHPGGATFWADFVYNLRAGGYDGTLNIEHEDALVNSVEGVGRAAALSSNRSPSSSCRTGPQPRYDARSGYLSRHEFPMTSA
jgi:hypothetical protein